MARPTSPKQFSRLILYAVIVAAVLGLSLWPPISFRSEVAAGSGALSHLEAIRNETLGTHAIFAISLPSRVDKRDNIILGSSVRGFHIEIIDATTPDGIDIKTYPYVSCNEASKAALLTSPTRIGITITGQLSTRLDVRTSTLCNGCGRRSRWSSSSPYGDDWDILWLGHCGIECSADRPYYLTPADPTVPPPGHFLPYWRDPPPLERPDDARMTCPITDGVCSIVYAVSFRGAQRILAALSVNPSGLAEQIDIGAQFDVSLGWMCGAGYLRCFAPYPSLTGGYKSAGPAAKGSDINGPDDAMGSSNEGELMQGPFSHGVMYSTMLNVNQLLAGKETVLATWDDVPIKEINPAEVGVLGGSLQMPKD
ncbi:hypothetical protein BDW72DRAFT_189193 [Aspergillus terricola var. indicus]